MGIDKVREEVESLERIQGVSHEDLVKGHGGWVLKIAVKYLKDDRETLERVERIRGNGFRVSIERLAQEQGVSYEDLKRGSRKGLLMGARKYLRDDREAWGMVKKIEEEALKVSVRKLEEMQVSYEELNKGHIAWLLIKARKILKQDDETQERIRKIRREALKLSVEKLEQGQSVSYEELMSGYNKGLLMLAEEYLRDDKDGYEIVMKVKRKALEISFKNIAVNGSVNPTYLCRNYAFLYRALRKVCKGNGKVSAQAIAGNAGIFYFQKHKHRTLKELLDDISEIGDEPGALTKGPFETGESGLGRVTQERFGLVGKGIILAGIDYLDMGIRGIRKERYVFSERELKAIVSDDSLSEDEKARCAFNALSLQYYPFMEFGCQVDRTTISFASPLKPVDCNKYLNGKLEIAVEPGDFQDVSCAVGIYLSKDIKNRFHATTFDFQGENSEDKGIEFYVDLEEFLGFFK